MKRFFYQYFCLIYSAIAAIMTVAAIVAIVEQIPIDKVNHDFGNTILMFILWFVVLFILAIPEKLIRGVNFGNFFVDCLNIALVSPIRFIFQIITIIRLHISASNGDKEFGKRVKLGKYQTVDTYYLFFNSEVYISERQRKKPVKKSEKQLTYERIVREMNQALDNANHFLTVNKRNDGRYNVYIVPLCNVDSKEFSPFSVQNNNYTGERHIKELYVNGHKIIEMDFDNTLVLSLRPGTYDFKIKVEGNAKTVSYSNSDSKVSKTFTLNNVYVGDEDVYLCVSMAFSPVVTQYQNISTGRIVKEEFEYFKKRYQFSRVSLETLNTVCNYWMAYKFEINEAHTQLSAQRYMRNH